MKILSISGSCRKGSRTKVFLEAIALHFTDYTFEKYELDQLPLFHPDAYDHRIDEKVTDFKNIIDSADLLLIATPEYIHNIPAILKNALEWTTQTGEINLKKVLPIVFTPHTPRGEKAMISLLNSLKALDAQIPASLMLHHDILDLKDQLTQEGIEIFRNIWEVI